MYIRRNYSRSVYHRNRSPRPLLMLIVGIVIGGLLILVSQQFDGLQAEALKIVGVVAAPTPFPGVYANTAAQKFAAGDLEGARQDYGRAVEIQPDNLSYLYEYSQVLLELGLTEQVVPLADRAIQLAPNDPRGYAMKANALAWSDPGNAIPLAIQARNLDPNFAPAYSALAIAYNNVNRYELALENGERAIQLDPNDPNTYRAYAWPLIYLGQSAVAVEQLETAVSINPNLTGPYFQLAFEYKSRLNQSDMAVAIYEHILTMPNVSTDDAAKANLRICETYNLVEKVEFRFAEPYCQAAIEIKPDYGSAYRELGRMRYRRRNYEGAIEAFETCVALGATDIECWALRGLAHYLLGNCDEAWQILNEASVRASAQSEAAGITDTIEIGLYNVTQKCDGYRNMPTATPILPTPIPPTPIGGL